MAATPTVESLLQQWIEAFNSHDLDRHMQLYTQDATLFGGVDELKLGRDAIRAYFGDRPSGSRVKHYPMPHVRELAADVAVTAGFVDFANGDADLSLPDDLGPRQARRRLAHHPAPRFAEARRRGVGTPGRHHRGNASRALLHNQGGGARHRARAQHGVRLHEAVGRSHQRLQRDRGRNHVPPLLAAGRCRRLRGRDAKPLQQLSKSAERRPSLRSKTIPPCCDLVVRQLTQLGYRCLEASDGTAALEITREREGRSAVYRRHHARSDETLRSGARSVPALAWPAGPADIGLSGGKAQRQRLVAVEHAPVDQAVPKGRARSSLPRGPGRKTPG